MPNPRFIDREGNPTVELLNKLAKAKEVYLGNLENFCEKWEVDKEKMKLVEGVYLIGSHATENSWEDNNSDVDFKLIVPSALPMDLFRYKKEILDPILCPRDQQKRRWIDLFFVHSEYQVLPPRYDLTKYWNQI